MRFFYAISIFLYGFGIGIARFFNAKAKEWWNGRKKPLWTNLPTENRNVVWFHCASLGEFDQGLPLMEAWKKKFPTDFLLVTFFSPSGMLHYHKRKHPADAVDYLPLDTKRNAKKFIERVQPKTTFFVKYEFWSNYLHEAKKHGSKIYSVSTILRPDQIYFKTYGQFYRSILQQFDHFFVQDQRTADLLEKINLPNVSVTGDLRFDRVFQNKAKASPNATIEKFLQGEKAFVIGSSWPEDEKILKCLLNDAHFSKKVILAPHDISENHLQFIENILTQPSVRYTHFENQKSTENLPNILLLDTIGHLTNAYQYGEFSYVGGGFSGSLHNILEPAVFGLPVIFGPKHAKFPEAAIFIEKGFAFELNDENSLLEAVQTLQSQKANIQEKLLIYMESQTGIAERIMGEILG